MCFERGFRLALTTLVAASTLAACADWREDTRPGGAAVTTAGTSALPLPARPGSGWSPEPAVDSTDPLLAGFEEVQARLAGDVGVAVAPVGGGQSLLAGPWQTGVAWSTIKVPLAIAALRESGDGTALDAARHAISASDNTAAEQLWNFLGPPPTAADKIEAVLRESGDVSTQVQSEILRSGFSSFGQTVWTLSDQAQFAAMLPCRPDAESLLELMRTTTADGGWGLATLRGTRSKGGWGPDERGRYLARQFGILDSRSGRYAVALAAEPASGALTDATAMITTLAHWVAVRAQTFPANAGC